MPSDPIQILREIRRRSRPLVAYADSLAQHLAPDEILIFVGTRLQSPFGDDSELELDKNKPYPPENPPRKQRWYLGADATGAYLNSARLDRLVYGVSAVGGPTSIAASIMRAKRSSPIIHYAVTNQRFIMFTASGLSVNRTSTPVLTFPVDAIRSASVDSRTFPIPQRGRTILEFTDGSRFALLTGFMSTKTSRNLVAALRHLP